MDEYVVHANFLTWYIFGCKSVHFMCIYEPPKKNRIDFGYKYNVHITQDGDISFENAEITPIIYADIFEYVEKKCAWEIEKKNILIEFAGNRY